MEKKEQDLNYISETVLGTLYREVRDIVKKKKTENSEEEKGEE